MQTIALAKYYGSGRYDIKFLFPMQYTQKTYENNIFALKKIWGHPLPHHVVCVMCLLGLIFIVPTRCLIMPPPPSQ